MAKKRKSKSPGRKARGANLDALTKAAKAAAARPRNRGVYEALGPVVLRDLVPPLRAVRDRPRPRSTAPGFIPPALKPSPRQPQLQPSPPARKLPPLRATTAKALGESPKARRSPERMSEAMREAICGEYRRDRAKRRESMFAKGSAGKGRRNTGQRQLDWRARYC